MWIHDACGAGLRVAIGGGAKGWRAMPERNAKRPSSSDYRYRHQIIHTVGNLRFKGFIFENTCTVKVNARKLIILKT
jgi:hypothetical protein